MDFCNLGKTNITVPIMGVGTMLWLPKDNLTEEDLFQTYQACLEHGMDFFDTAEIYGNGTSESLLGKFQQRDGRKIKVATKFAPPSTMNPLTQKRKTVSNDSPEALLEALDGSLERLQVDCVDLYQMHTPPKNGRISDYMDVMAKAVHSGKVRAVGVCNFSKDQIQMAHDALAKHDIPLATAMTGYNILRRYPETNGVFEICRKHDITVIPYAPLAEGTLTGKYRSGVKKVPLMYKVCIVTGSNSGTGYAAAKKLAKLEATVVMMCRNGEKGEKSSYELAEQLQGTGVTLNVTHPGAVNSGFTDKFDKAHWLKAKFVDFVGSTPEKAAKRMVYLATSPDVENITGKYWGNCKESKSSKTSRDSAQIKRIWKETETILHNLGYTLWSNESQNDR